MLPATSGPLSAKKSDASPKAAPEGRQTRVLYVDDEQLLVYLVTRQLERRGYHVRGFVSVDEALGAFRDDPSSVDVVITDYNMPRASGLTVTAELMRIRSDTPVLVTSGYVSEEMRANVAGAGARGLIYKPNTVDELCDAISVAVGDL